MKTKLIALFAVVMLCSVIVHAQFSQNWASVYDNPNGGGLTGESARDIKTDVSGNTYSAIYNGGDIVLVKYSLTGSRLWSSTYNGTGNGSDYPSEIALDPSGNIYLTGYSMNYAGNYDLLLLKYNSAGTLLWVRTFNGAANGTDVGTGIWFSSNANTVSVTGYSNIGVSDDDILTIQWDANGTQLWFDTRGGSQNLHDQGNDIIADDGGNVYTVGNIKNNASQYTGRLYKYNSSGVFQWSAIFAGGLGYGDEAVAVALDTAKNIIVVGSVGNSGTSVDIGTAKYTPAGTQSWKKTITSLYINNDYGTDVLVDVAGNIYTLGYTNDGSNNSTYLAKYDPLGNSVWGGNYVSAATPVEMEFDLFGNLIYIGKYSSGDQDVFAQSVTPVTRVVNWTRTFSGTPASYYDYCMGVSVDGSGNVHLCGQSFNSAQQDATLVTWDNSGNFWWSDFWAMTISSSYDAASDMSMDAGKNVYVTGYTYNNSTTKEDFVTIKYNEFGVQQWATLCNGTANNNDRGKAIAVDAAGNVYTAGYISNSSGYRDYGTVKYNSAGVQQWRSIYTGTLTNVHDSATAIAVDAGGNVYVTGMANNTTSNGDWVTIKYNASGTQKWAKILNGTANNNDIGRAISVDAAGNVYVCGSVQNTGFNNDYGVVKYDSSGTQVWAKYYNGTMGLNDYAVAMAVDAAGNVYVTGYAYNTGAVNDIVTVKFDANGNQLWVKEFNGSAGSNDYGNSIALDGGGNVVVCGTTASSGSGDDFVTIRYDASGNQLWLKVFDGPGNGNDRAVSIKTDLGKRVYTTGTALSQSQTLYYNYKTIVYDSTGAALDTLTYTPGANATCSAVDPNGGVVVSGNSLVNTWRDIHTTGYCAAPTASAGSNVSICLGGSTTLNASGGTSYLWSPAAGLSSTTIANPVASPTATTTYTVTVANASCNSTASVTVTVTSSITVTATSNHDSICSGSGAILSGHGANTYTWNPGGLSGSSVTVSPATTTTYTVTGTDLGSCSNTANITIIVDQPPTTAAAGPDQNICINSSSLAGNTPSSGVGHWSVLSGTATITSPSLPTSGITGLGFGPNTLQWTISNGHCTASVDDVTITYNTIPVQPGAIIGPASSCSGSVNTYSVTAVNGATAYTWTLPGGWAGASTTNSITATTGSAGGNISVTANNSCGSGNAQTLAVSVSPVPAQPGTISGPTSICSGSSNTYSVSAVSGATSYTWALPGGWSGTSTTNSITATAGSSNGNITVTANSGCGSGPAQTLPVSVNATPVTPGTISGATVICTGSTNTYSVNPVSGATSYTWVLPGGWSGTSTTNSITATAGSAGGNVTVTADNACGSSNAQILSVTVNSAPVSPGAISGATSICSGSGNVYSVPPVSGATSYTWTFPSGWSGTGTTNSITALAGTTSGNVSVTANNSCGSGTAQTLMVTVNSIPATPGTISGATSLCTGSSYAYSVNTVSGATSYTWTLPGGWSGTSITNTITATAGTVGGNITVTANNTCGSSPSNALVVSVNLPPATPGSISGNASVCQNSNNSYSIVPVAGATSYTWVLPPGWTGSSTTNSINTTAGSSSGNITIMANNSCGSSSVQTFAVTITPTPTIPGAISGNATVCQNSNNTYSITPVAGATSYSWVLPAGWIGSSVTSSINTTAGSAGGNITVTANNTCGTSGQQSMAVSVNGIPTAPGLISGNTDICQSSNSTYSIAPVPGATSYVWVLPTGWTGTSTSTSINATAGTTGGDISVTAVNSCGSSATQTLTVLVSSNTPMTPGPISGSTSVCSGSINSYSIAPVPGATSYTWILPGGWTGTSVTNSITTTSGSLGGNIAVTANNACGSSFAQLLAVTVLTTPASPGSITGATSVCSGTVNTYSITPVSGATSYVWSLPSGWTGSSISYSINATSGMTGGNIIVAASNACGTSGTQSLTVNVIAAPVTPGSITGPLVVCSGSTHTYSINPVAGANNYTWTLPAGWNGTSSTNSINAMAGQSGGNVSVTASNGCGTSSPQTYTVSVNNPPATPGTISGLTTICAGSSNTYAVSPVSGATSYTWTLPSGWSGTSSTNSITAIAGTVGGTISVTANDSCGSSIPNTLPITVNTIPGLPSAISGPTTICEGSSDTYSIVPVGNATSYSWVLPSGWSGSSMVNSINTTAGSVSGTILVSANNSCGAGPVRSLTVTVNLLPTVSLDLTLIDTLCNNSSDVMLTSGTPSGGNYSGNGVVAGVFSPSAAGPGTSIITYSYTDGNNCTNTASASIFVETCTDIETAGMASSFVVFPNPFSSVVTLVFNGDSGNSAKIEITDMAGKILKKIDHCNSEMSIDLSALSAGVYLMRIINPYGTVHSKLVKQ